MLRCRRSAVLRDAVLRVHHSTRLAEIRQCPLHTSCRVSELPESRVARPAQEPPHFPALMIVVDDQWALPLTDGTGVALRRRHLLQVLSGDAVSGASRPQGGSLSTLGCRPPPSSLPHTLRVLGTLVAGLASKLVAVLLPVLPLVLQPSRRTNDRRTTSGVRPSTVLARKRASTGSRVDIEALGRQVPSTLLAGHKDLTQ